MENGVAVWANRDEIMYGINLVLLVNFINRHNMVNFNFAIKF